jgi:hypothetical protein
VSIRRLIIRSVVLAAGALSCIGAAMPAQAQAVSEYAVKSALLFKLPKFVYRPEVARERTINICVLGRNPFDGALERLAQTPIGQQAVNVLHLGTAAEAAACDFVFIARSETSALDTILRRLAGYPVVTVSDIEGFAGAGGMVEFALGGENAAIAILINRRAARAQSFEFNAQLLRLSRVVEP